MPLRSQTKSLRRTEVTGGYGYHRGPIERAFRDARAAIAIGNRQQVSRAVVSGLVRHLRATGYEIAQDRRVPNWRATADEDEHYCFAVAL